MVTRGLYIDEDLDGFETIDILEQVRAVLFYPIDGLLGYSTFLRVSFLQLHPFQIAFLQPLLSTLCPFFVELRNRLSLPPTITLFLLNHPFPSISYLVFAIA
jgi:hypothetical protein